MKRIDIEKEYNQYLETGIIKPMRFNKFSDIQNIRLWQKICDKYQRREYNKANAISISEKAKIYKCVNNQKIKVNKIKYYNKNSQNIKQKRKVNYKNNSSQIKEKRKIYYRDNVDTINKYQKKHYKQNVNEIKKKRKEIYIANRSDILCQKKEYYQQNVSAIKERNKNYRQNNRQKLKDKRRQYQTKRRKDDPIFKFSKNIRSSIRMSFKRQGTTKISKTQIMLGISIEQFRKYIQSKFKDGMTLQNYGIIWNLDHIIPLASARSDFPCEEELQRRIVMLNHYTNFQPLFVQENLQKSDKIQDGTILPWADEAL